MTPKQGIQRRAVLTAAHNDFSKMLNTHAFFKLQDSAMGEDMVQKTFMKTWVYLVKGGKIDIMKAFLYHILNNLIIDQYRKHKTTSLDTLVEAGFEPSTDDSDRMVNFIDGKMLIKLIPFLPDAYRKVMHMRFVQDLSLKEMALITGQTKNTMAVKVHRGLAKLKLLYVPAAA